MYAKFLGVGGYILKHASIFTWKPNWIHRKNQFKSQSSSENWIQVSSNNK